MSEEFIEPDFEATLLLAFKQAYYEAPDIDFYTRSSRALRAVLDRIPPWVPLLKAKKEGRQFLWKMDKTREWAPIDVSADLILEFPEKCRIAPLEKKVGTVYVCTWIENGELRHSTDTKPEVLVSLHGKKAGFRMEPPIGREFLV